MFGKVQRKHVVCTLYIEFAPTILYYGFQFPFFFLKDPKEYIPDTSWEYIQDQDWKSQECQTLQKWRYSFQKVFIL